MEKIKKKSLLKKIIGGKRPAELILYIFAFTIFVIFAFSYLYCLFWCLMSGLKTHTQIALDPFALPTALKLKNYIDAFSLIKVGKTNFFGMFFNSVYFSVLGALINVMCTCMLAYVTTKYKFPCSGIFFYISLIMMMLPIYGSGGAAYKLFSNLGLINSRLMIITSTAGLGIYYMYFHAFYKNMSNAYAESAKIDGANHFAIFFRIAFPMSMPMFGALFLLTWVGEWNNYASQLIYLPGLPTLAAGIHMFKIQMTFMVRMDIFYAACFMSCVPPLAMFALFSKVLTSNISLGGIKG